MFSTLTDQVRSSPQRSSRNGATIDTFLIHHQASTNDDATIDAMVSGSKEVSANYTISSEGRLTGVVDEEDRAWTSASSSWDGRAITVEIENETAGPEWRISEAALDRAAELLADLRTRYDIVNVLGHRDLYTAANGWASYSTYCPGPNTVATIVAREANPTVIPKEIPMGAKLYRNTENGSVVAADISTGFKWPVPNPDYLKLVEGWNLFEAPRVELPGNIFNFVMGLVDRQRAVGGGTVDQAVINAITTGVVNGVVAQLGESLTDEQVTDIIAGVVAEVPKAVADEQARRLQS